MSALADREGNAKKKFAVRQTLNKHEDIKRESIKGVNDLAGIKLPSSLSIYIKTFVLSFSLRLTSI